MHSFAAMSEERIDAREERHGGLVRKAHRASRRMRLIGSTVFFLAAITTAAVLGSWISGFYSWEVAIPILFATITGGLLTGTAAWAQSFGIDLNAARFEIMRQPAGREPSSDDDGETPAER